MTLDNCPKVRQLAQRSARQALFGVSVLSAHSESRDTARIFSTCYERRNLAEYEGHFDVD